MSANVWFRYNEFRYDFDDKLSFGMLYVLPVTYLGRDTLVCTGKIAQSLQIPDPNN